jgi:hypothetical protein
MMGIEVGAATEDGVVSWDFAGGESLDWEIGDDGGEEMGFCGARVDGAGVYISCCCCCGCSRSARRASLTSCGVKRFGRRAF